MQESFHAVLHITTQHLKRVPFRRCVLRTLCYEDDYRSECWSSLLFMSTFEYDDALRVGLCAILISITTRLSFLAWEVFAVWGKNFWTESFDDFRKRCWSFNSNQGEGCDRFHGWSVPTKKVELYFVFKANKNSHLSRAFSMGGKSYVCLAAHSDGKVKQVVKAATSEK